MRGRFGVMRTACAPARQIARRVNTQAAPPPISGPVTPMMGRERYGKADVTAQLGPAVVPAARVRGTHSCRISASTGTKPRVTTPGPRIAAVASNRVLFLDGLPIAALEGGEIRSLSDDFAPGSEVEKALRIGQLPVSLRPYYG